ncbi:MAG: hypothetical protein U9O97_07485, partial [Elusimicrobiota bacterium]|nr:hypothetical protein [Elusimicrobiota bacterium]
GFAYNEVFGVDSLSTSPVTVEIIKLIEEDNASAENPARGYHGKGPEFSLGYERVPAEYHTPCSKASWSWNGGSGEWDVSGSYNNYQHRDKKVFPFVFSGFARTKAISPSFSAGFETGLYIPLSDSRDGWSVPFFSTSTSPSTVYNYQTEPSTCSSFYNSDKRKLMVLPVMARLDWDAPGFLNISLGAGVYITHLQIESVTGEMFYAEYKDSDGKTHSPGDVSEYSFWRSENKIIPAAKCALSTHLKVSENSGFKLSFAAAALRKTDFLFQEYNFGGNSFRDGVVIGGMSYGFSAAWKILF